VKCGNTVTITAQLKGESLGLKKRSNWLNNHQKDHYMAFKRAKKLANYLYKAACSAAAGFTRPAVITPVAWLSDTGASVRTMLTLFCSKR